MLAILHKALTRHPSTEQRRSTQDNTGRGYAMSLPRGSANPLDRDLDAGRRLPVAIIGPLLSREGGRWAEMQRSCATPFKAPWLPRSRGSPSPNIIHARSCCGQSSHPPASGMSSPPMYVVPKYLTGKHARQVGICCRIWALVITWHASVANDDTQRRPRDMPLDLVNEQSCPRCALWAPRLNLM